MHAVLFVVVMGCQEQVRRYAEVKVVFLGNLQVFAEVLVPLPIPLLMPLLLAVS